MPASIDFLSPALAGYGRRKDWQIGRPVSLAEEASRIEPLLAVARNGVHLIGHSYGGAVAMEIARRWPDRVRSLTLYEPARFSVLLELDLACWQSVHRLGSSFEVEALACTHEVAASRFIDFWSGTGCWEAMDLQTRSRVVSYMPKVRAEFDALLSDSVPLRAWSALQMPVHLLSGDKSPAAAQLIVNRLAEVIPHAHARCLANCGHMAPVYDAPTVMQAMGLLSGSPILAAA